MLSIFGIISKQANSNFSQKWSSYLVMIGIYSLMPLLQEIYTKERDSQRQLNWFWSNGVSNLSSGSDQVYTWKMNSSV